jgi:thioredoxin reductase (NADPH)
LFDPADVPAQLTAQVAELTVAGHEQADQLTGAVIVENTGPSTREWRHLFTVPVHRDDKIFEGHRDPPSRRVGRFASLPRVDHRVHRQGEARSSDPTPTRVRDVAVTRPDEDASMADVLLDAERFDETPDLYGAFPELSEAQVVAVAGRGERETTHVGDVLYREGDRPCDFIVILNGKVAVVEGYGSPDQQVVGVHGPRRFLGDISVLTGQAMFVTAVVVEAGEVLRIPVEELRELVTQDTALGDLVLRAYLLRRSILIEVGAGFRILGSCYSPDTRRLREFAARNRLPHRFIDLDQDTSAEELLRLLGIRPEETPVVICRRDRVMRNPSSAELADAIGLPTPKPSDDVYDLLIVGAGPSGLAAAVYGASEGLRTIVLDSTATGGQAGLSTRIENYLGFPAGLSGAELAERAALQAKKFGADFAIPAEAVALDREDGFRTVTLSDQSTMTARAVVIASGVRYRRLPIPDVDRFEGTSVYYAATLVEAHQCIGQPVVVVGGGNSAGQAAVFLSSRASLVHLVVRGSDLEANMSRYLVDRLQRLPGVEIHLDSTLRQLDGDRALRRVEVENNRAGDRKWVDANAVFVFIGAEPCTHWLSSEFALDERGFVLVGPDAVPGIQLNGAHRRPLPSETSVAGVFAVGDVRVGSIKRVASAVGEGSMVVRLVHEYLDELVGRDDVRAAPVSRSAATVVSSPS